MKSDMQGKVGAFKFGIGQLVVGAGKNKKIYNFAEGDVQGFVDNGQMVDFEFDENNKVLVVYGKELLTEEK